MHSTRKINTIAGLMFFLALIGFADATYLTIEHFLGGIIPCSLVSGCQIVTTSVYSTIGPVPISLLGALYYFSILFGLLIYFDSKNTKLFYWLCHYTIFGFLTSVVLVIIQVFVLHSICLYCMTSALSSTLLYGVAHQYWKRSV